MMQQKPENSLLGENSIIIVDFFGVRHMQFFVRPIQ